MVSVALKQLGAIPTPVSIQYVLYPANRQPTDLGNVCSIHQKFMEDALVELGVLPDDSIKEIPMTTYLYGSVDKANPRVEVIIQTIKQENSQMKLIVELSATEIRAALMAYMAANMQLPPNMEPTDMQINHDENGSPVASFAMSSVGSTVGINAPTKRKYTSRRNASEPQEETEEAPVPEVPVMRDLDEEEAAPAVEAPVPTVTAPEAPVFTDPAKEEPKSTPVITAKPLVFK